MAKKQLYQGRWKKETGTKTYRNYSCNKNIKTFNLHMSAHIKMLRPRVPVSATKGMSSAGAISTPPIDFDRNQGMCSQMESTIQRAPEAEASVSMELTPPESGIDFESVGLPSAKYSSPIMADKFNARVVIDSDGDISNNSGYTSCTGDMALLQPLLQQTEALASGRLANYNDDLAVAVVGSDFLGQCVYLLDKQNIFDKKKTAFVLRVVAKHSPQFAQAVVDCGALQALVICLEEFDPGVKEAAAWALGYIAHHNAELSQSVVDAGAVPLLVLCIQEPELPLKRISAAALSDISKHSPELAQTVVDAGAIAHLVQLILNHDAKLAKSAHPIERQACSALSQIAKHSVDLAEMVVGEVDKHTQELAQLIVKAGGIAAVINYIGDARGNARLPGVMMLGYVGAHSERLAMAVILLKGAVQLAIVLSEEKEDHIKAAAAWALGQIGRHTPQHAKSVAVANVLPKLLHCYLSAESSEDLQTKAKKALKNILQRCIHLPALEPLLHNAPPNILKHVVNQFSKVLPHDPKARKLFVTSGGLKKIQEIRFEHGSALHEYVNTINNSYPAEIVNNRLL